jgi:sarcosine oxidase delta subunit
MILHKKKFKWLCQRTDVSQIDNIISNIVSERKINYFIEPFSCGISTAVELTPILKEYNINNIIVNNVNQTAVDTYIYTRDNFEELFKTYWSYEEGFIKTFNEHVADKDKDKVLSKMKEYYEEQKKEFNNSLYENSIKHSALFLFLVNRSLNLTCSVNAKEEYVAPFCNEIHLFDKSIRKETFRVYNILFSSFNVVFEKMDSFDFINKYKNLHEESIFYFDPDYSNTFFEIFRKNNSIIEAEQISFTQFYKLLKNIIIKKDNVGIFKESFIEKINFKLNNDYYFKH